MVITGKHIPRRTFLRGAGVTVAIPFLDSMIPALASAATVPIQKLGSSLSFLRTGGPRRIGRTIAKKAWKG